MPLKDRRTLRVSTRRRGKSSGAGSPADRPTRRKLAHCPETDRGTCRTPPFGCSALVSPGGSTCCPIALRHSPRLRCTPQPDRPFPSSPTPPHPPHKHTPPPTAHPP